jgi:hypothetical protein
VDAGRPGLEGRDEATVRIAKRDLVLTAVNLRADYAELLAEERLRLHPVPEPR